MTITIAEYRKLKGLPLNANNQTNRAGPVAIVERTAGGEPLEAPQDKETHSGRVHIRFTSVRKRLLDPDNLSEKYLLDCLRYAGAIRGDEPEKITLETTQRKAAKGEAEHTMIEIMEGQP